ncbi:hypothetical protein [Paraburkholderia caribensis]|jgi:hypothetical protein|uniref:Uncharacterized protein n=1 Tax=Paraburkholderia caribensis TaxID=75105 RepID=A0A9Q6S134_9BURK|nr:hypothetical protein [Paraburkholderia caribensis]ALP61573.1 hypothetical protein AN416_02495 [Paraburkholderia caribensis]AUT53201.1 hypothetical protein C2L66_15980 [Paraburkholderia caribensis]MCO4875794.1 hypothetical protein [Paraburkholderia caribensis]PTB29688.1 hypothetical protein C9I56_06950 [Paraburkholderia caribensis]QLB62573.1 hypothetical protein A9O66_09375 [Paraburkholderia caribensis]
MTKAHIYQIYYSDQTRSGLDEGFIPLDNVGQRPDWREYWPIRRFLHEQTLDDTAFYGFLSPKFAVKTNLEASDVHAFLATVPESTDIVSFSPFFDAGALFTNVFLQGAQGHPNAWGPFDEIVRLLKPGIELSTLIMDSSNSVYCNYFVAKPRFWRHWLDQAEIVFGIAESNSTPLGKALNASGRHAMGDTPVKTFLIERLVSLLLATEKHWQVASFNPLQLPLVYPGSGKVAQELVMLDALKRAAVGSGRAEYMTVWSQLRERVVATITGP